MPRCRVQYMLRCRGQYMPRCRVQMPLSFGHAWLKPSTSNRFCLFVCLFVFSLVNYGGVCWLVLLCRITVWRHYHFKYRAIAPRVNNWNLEITLLYCQQFIYNSAPSYAEHFPVINVSGGRSGWGCLRSLITEAGSTCTNIYTDQSHNTLLSLR